MRRIIIEHEPRKQLSIADIRQGVGLTTSHIQHFQLFQDATRARNRN